MTDQQKWRFYGRRVGRKLNKTRQLLLEELLPSLEIKGNQITSNEDLDPYSLFTKTNSTPEKIILEIGFGNGEHLAEMMHRNSDIGFIGAEPFKNGMTAFLKEIKERNITNNIRVLMDDVLPLVKSLNTSSIDEIYILNPDPWHKTRHHQRRIVNQKNLNEFARILKPASGKLIMTTDVKDLIEWMVTQASIHSDFEWSATSADDWRVPLADWIPTRYETKGAKGADKMHYLFFDRV